MNKKIKIIELMQKCANKENIPERIAYKNTIFILNDCKNYYNEEKDERLLDYIIPTFSNLNDYVEILEDNTEDNTEEIEELLIKLLEKVKNTPDDVIEQAIDSLQEKLRKEKE